MWYGKRANIEFVGLINSFSFYEFQFHRILICAFHLNELQCYNYIKYWKSKCIRIVQNCKSIVSGQCKFYVNFEKFQKHNRIEILSIIYKVVVVTKLDHSQFDYIVKMRTDDTVCISCVFWAYNLSNILFFLVTCT